MKDLKMWSMILVIKNKERKELLKKIAAVCNVILTEKEPGFFILEDPMPNQKDWEKFLNTIEIRNIVQYIDYRTLEEGSGIILSDEEGENDDRY